ncbi:MAG: hypothetical protein CHACPFDD_02130 [Phycisphaerae bacterium]|nr:hypothetical protein [Phycisphaerae bacterium]
MAGLDNSTIVHFYTCHIWPGSCYDSRCHTVVANLVLIPSPLAALSDHDPESVAALKFRAFAPYRWHPPGHKAPVRPAYYPVCWRKPEPFTPEIETHIGKRNYGPGG